MDKKLSPAMQDLLDAMNRGVKVHFMEYMGGSTEAYYFRADTMKPCTKQVEGLIKRRLAKTVSEGYGRNTRVIPTTHPTQEADK